MNLILTVDMEDDALEGHIDIYDDPCSMPYCANINVPAPGSLLACMVEYIAHGGDLEWYSVYREYEDLSVSFSRDRILVSVKDAAHFVVLRRNIKLDMSTPGGER